MSSLIQLDQDFPEDTVIEDPHQYLSFVLSEVAEAKVHLALLQQLRTTGPYEGKEEIIEK